MISAVIVDTAQLACPWVLPVAMIALTIASTVVQQVYQADAAKEQKKQIEAQAEFEREQALTAAREKREAAAVEQEQVAIKGMKARGKVQALGLTGLSADAVLRDVGAIAARAKHISDLNFEIGNRRAGNELHAAGLNRSARLSEVRGADWLGAGLTIGASIAGGAAGMMDGGAAANTDFGALGGLGKTTSRTSVVQTH